MHITLLLLLTLLVPILMAAAPATQPSLNARDFGAMGDGKSDDTAALQRGLDAAGATGSPLLLPAGHYLVKGTLKVPPAVTLQGTYEAPPRRYAGPQTPGSVLLAVAGRGEADGEPFITLRECSAVVGVMIHYPEQTPDVAPYPWTIRGIGDNCTIRNVLITNPYQAVDFGTYPAGRHYINGLNAQALKTGLLIDKCFDVGRVENVHFWPFWSDDERVKTFMRTQGTAFVIGRTDWEYMTNCFTIWYAVGFHFKAFADGPGNVVLTNSGADIGPVAVRVDAVQGHAGVSFTNGQFMAGIEVGPENPGPVKFTSCGFWGEGATDHHAVLAGKGHTTFTACHFTAWGQTKPDAPAIVLRSGGLTLSGCEFLDEGDKAHVRLESGAEAALVLGNRFRAPPAITDDTDGRAVIGMNLGPATRPTAGRE